jgi:hypothetical protein
MSVEQESEPLIALEQVITQRDEMMGCWNIAWLVRNLGRYPMSIVSVHLPHSQFKSVDRRLDCAINLNGGEEVQFRTCVRCNEPAGLVTENAFVIFHLTWLADQWRIFVRLRVVVNSDGTPETATELITTQKVGFSGVPS